MNRRSISRKKREVRIEKLKSKRLRVKLNNQTVLVRRGCMFIFLLIGVYSIGYI
jgi:hypothetical protein